MTTQTQTQSATAQNVYSALRSMYQNSGESLLALQVIVRGGKNALKLARHRLQVMAPGDRPQQLVVDVNRLLNRLSGYDQDLGFAGLSDAEEGAHAHVAAQMFNAYTGGEVLDSGLGWLGTTEPYTPNSRPEAWKLGSILSQMATLDGIEHEINASAAWDKIKSAMGEAADAVSEATGLDDAKAWLDETLETAGKIALGVAGGVAILALLAGAFFVYQATKK